MWDHSTFPKNRDRLLGGDIAARFLSAILAQPRVRRLLSSEHFSVDRTLGEAWAEQPKVPTIRRIVGKAAEGSMKSLPHSSLGYATPPVASPALVRDNTGWSLVAAG